jgi:SAM-dependent methyltransferase
VTPAPAVVDAGVLAFARAALPAPPARLLEVGAGSGELAAVLRQEGYDVVAIDSGESAPGVTRVALRDLVAPVAMFDAALAVVSLHHVRPLAPSCQRLAEVVRPGGALVVDEFDVERFDERAAAWWLEQRRAADVAGEGDAAGLVAGLREHLHPVAALLVALAPHFELERPVTGPYLHRWNLPPGLRAGEEELIAAERLPATGVRLVGVRR